ncbi:fimbrial protein [Salmonella enterica subsp. enterica]|uniref:Fimbrial protein n=1 Tax=Salmonella enterica I TaxID=59201 RepID=A0A447TMB7_SALET|nr:fimbrial protein [Salmonella enterica subsp. enterica]
MNLLLLTPPPIQKRLVWSEVEINSKEVPLIAIMKETKANSATTGAFSAVATFVFSYE